MTTKKIKSSLRESRGRPLSFNRDHALKKALMLFWQKGYDNTSINDLTAAMKISPPSLYASFGNKEKLFWEVVELYSSEYAINIGKILSEDENVKEALHFLLQKIAENYTKQKTPHGCLIVCASDYNLKNSTRVQRVLLKMRQVSETVLVNKIKEAVQSKQIPQHTNAKTLGKFFATLIQGMTIQSRDGASYEDLLNIVDLAMQVWPGFSV